MSSKLVDNIFLKEVEKLVERDSRYALDAYGFISQTIQYAMSKLEAPRHISAYELLEFVRDYADKEFGIFAVEVLSSWGIKRAKDVGNLVYIMIDAKLLSSSENDKQQDFDIEFDLKVPLEKIDEEIIELPKIDC